MDNCLSAKVSNDLQTISDEDFAKTQLKEASLTQLLNMTWNTGLLKVPLGSCQQTSSIKSAVLGTTKIMPLMCHEY